ncbi:hypothetical protein MOO44_05885 [Nicoliella spurrieriana]|uniref:Competence protein CoiA n=1 Tax=Nicoliella spurrieriana TaxID=2925830 RepID=A0A976RRF1_9LACO|nr:competence protein CoiA family protein [Nicoliella spurrieriana]UQS86423.1 hypothetical protein MOO44_05885 [Nicoliella spurrieriana]
MLIAYNKQKLILADNATKDNEFKCPCCNQRVILRCGTIKTPHFAHRSKAECNSFSEGETKEHLLGKKQLFQFFLELKPQLEYYFTNLKQRPDIRLSGSKLIEFQCSPISNQRLSERLCGYRSIAHESIWILGSPYLKKRNSILKLKKFLRYNINLGFYLLYWDINSNHMEIHHHFRLLLGQIQYDVQFIKTLSELKKLFNQKNIVKHSLNPTAVKFKLTKRITNFQKQVILNQDRMNAVQNLCYQYQFNYVGYPLSLDYPIFEAPILGYQLINFKIVALIFLKNQSKMEISNLINRVNHFLNIDQDFYMINDKIINFFIIRIFQQWVKLGFAKTNRQYIKLVDMPKWYSSYDDKINSINYFMSIFVNKKG